MLRVSSQVGVVRINRALINPQWLDKFPTAYANYLPSGISDHSPIVINIAQTSKKKGFPFKFYNYWTSFERFANTVNLSWSQGIQGTYQFQLCHQLRNLKYNLKNLTKDSIGKEKILADKARENLILCQTDLDAHPDSPILWAQERQLEGIFLDAIRIEEEAMRQKSRIQWLEAGDRNTAYFHNYIKNYRNRKRIVSLL